MDTITSDIQSYLMTFFLCLISSLLVIQFLFKKPKKPNLHLPPSPPTLPFIGHLHLLRLVMSKCLDKLSSKYGPIFYIRLGSRPSIVVSSSKIAAEIYKTNDLSFSERRPSSFADGLYGNSSFVTSPYGEYWRFMKKLCMTELLSPLQIERSRGVRRDEIGHFLNELVEKACRKEVVDVSEELLKLANDIICRMVISRRFSEEDDEGQRLRKLLSDSKDMAGKLMLCSMLGPLKGLGYWVIKKQFQGIDGECDELFEKIIKEHEEKAKRNGGFEREDKDLMDILLDAYHDKNAEFNITKSQMKIFVMELFSSGTDATADVVEWVMAELINHPEAFKKLREEIESVVGINRLVEESDIPNLHYLKAVVDETMRLYPIAPGIIRKCREDCNIAGFDIPKETGLVVNAYSIMRDPKMWDNPNDFIPERFLEEEKKTRVQIFSFLPFGGGRRMCPASNLALTIVNIAVAAMVQCFDWKVDGGRATVNMEVKAGAIMKMAHPLKCHPIVHFNLLSASNSGAQKTY